MPPPSGLVDSSVGSFCSGCPDQVPTFLFPGIGVRINCMRGVDPATGFGTSNLQTFLVVFVPGGPGAMQNSQTEFNKQ